MGIQLIDTFEDPYYDLNINLDGSVYSLDFRYNNREACWYISVSDAAASLIAGGLKVVCNTDLLRFVNDERRPPGVLLALATGANNDPPSLLELGAGKRVELLYFPVAT